MSNIKSYSLLNVQIFKFMVKHLKYIYLVNVTTPFKIMYSFTSKHLRFIVECITDSKNKYD